MEKFELIQFNDNSYSTAVCSVNNNGLITNNTNVPVGIDACFSKRQVYFISDIHLFHHIDNELVGDVTDEEISKYIKTIVKSLFTDELIEDIQNLRKPIILFGGDISSSFRIAQEFYQVFCDEYKAIENEKHNVLMSTEKKAQNNNIFAILGNHEFWGFSSYEECLEAYKQLFKDTEITLLNFDMYYIDGYQVPSKQELSPKQDHKEYERRLLSKGNMMLVGGVGFAAENKAFNATQMIYQKAIDVEEEKRLTEEWRKFFLDALAVAKEQCCLLVVLSHMPVQDWIGDAKLPSNCVFFSGHTHNNTAFIGDNNNYFFSNNQLGYKSKDFWFKKYVLYKYGNPYASYPDGYYETKVNEYFAFNLYKNIKIGRLALINRQIELYGSQMYVIKKGDYYGFFLKSKRSLNICNGGAIKKIGESEDLDRYYQDFDEMVEKYLTTLSPLRNIQEQLSKLIKGIGGEGTIHGTIVDIDFYNHIMVDIENKRLIMYYSPFLGLQKRYDIFQDLLHEQLPALEKNYLEQGSPNLPAIKMDGSVSDKGYTLIDLKDSPYTLSRRINPLQKLFDNHILRAWDNKVLNDYASNVELLAPDTLLDAEAVETIRNHFEEYVKEENGDWYIQKAVNQRMLIALVNEFALFNKKKLRQKGFKIVIGTFSFKTGEGVDEVETTLEELSCSCCSLMQDKPNLWLSYVCIQLIKGDIHVSLANKPQVVLAKYS